MQPDADAGTWLHDLGGSVPVRHGHSGQAEVHRQQMEQQLCGTQHIDEDAVTLFLCDENRGNLTDEQRAFAEDRRAEFEHYNQITVYRVL